MIDADDMCKEWPEPEQRYCLQAILYPEQKIPFGRGGLKIYMEKYCYVGKYLLVKWENGISKLTSDDGLVIIGPATPDYLISLAKSTLGSRLLVLPGQDYSLDGGADDITALFEQKGVAFDTDTVYCEGWGASFAGCVTRNCAIIGERLNLKNPIEINAEMCFISVPFIMDAGCPCGPAKFIERISLAFHMRVFIFRDYDFRPCATFMQGFHFDNTVFLTVPIDQTKVEIVDMRDKIIEPSNKPNSIIYAAKGCLKIRCSPPLHGLRIFLRGTRISPSDFSLALKNTKITTTLE